MSFYSCCMYSKRIIFSSFRKNILGPMLCIGLSLVPLIAILSVSEGMISGITGRMIHLSSSDISVDFENLYFNDSEIGEFINASREIGAVEGVTNVWPEIQSVALACGKNYRSGAFVRGVTKDVFENNVHFKNLFKVTEGELSLSDAKSIIIGDKLSHDLDVHPGDSIRIITVDARRKAFVPKSSSFVVTAVISSGYQELDALWAFIPLESAHLALSKSSRTYRIGVETGETFSPRLIDIRMNLREHLDKKYENAAAYTWNELNAQQFENFSSTKSLIMIVMLLVVLVASINISSAVVMIVMDRKKEIAILKSVGSGEGGIAVSFLLVGFMTGLGGVVVGLPVGLLISFNMNGIIHGIENVVNFAGGILSMDGRFHLLDPAFYLQDIPVCIPVKQILIIVFGTLILSVLMSLMPSIRAGKEKPIETLRKM